MSVFFLVAQSKNTPFYRTKVQETKPTASLPPTSPTSKRRTRDVNHRSLGRTDDLVPRDLDLQGMFGLSHGFSSLREEETYPPNLCKEAPLLAMYLLSFDLMIGLGLHMFASSIGDQSLQNFALCTSAKALPTLHSSLWSFHATPCDVPDLLDALSNRA